MTKEQHNRVDNKQSRCNPDNSLALEEKHYKRREKIAQRQPWKHSEHTYGIETVGRIDYRCPERE